MTCPVVLCVTCFKQTKADFQKIKYPADRRIFSNCTDKKTFKNHILCRLLRRIPNRFSLCRNHRPNIRPIRPFLMPDTMDRLAIDLIAAVHCIRVAQGRRCVNLNSFELYYLTRTHLSFINFVLLRFQSDQKYIHSISVSVCVFYISVFFRLFFCYLLMFNSDYLKKQKTKTTTTI